MFWLTLGFFIYQQAGGAIGCGRVYDDVPAGR